MVKNFVNIVNKDISSNKIALFSFLFLGILVIGRWFFLINEYSVNVLFYDHWDLYGVFFTKASLLDLYTLQHGPHRQGIGFILTKYIDQISGWNTNWISYTIGILITLSSLVYLLIKKKYFGKITFFDLVILTLILTPSQFGVFANTPNISHGAMPVFLLSLFCFSLLIDDYKMQTILMVVLNFLIIYSGFGLLFGLICPVIFLVLIYYKPVDKSQLFYNTVGFVLTTLSMVLFFYNYKHAPANPHFQFPHDKPFEYVIFMAKMTKNALSIPKGLGDAFSYITLIFQIYILVSQLLLIIRKRAKNLNFSLIIISIIGFSLLFEIATAVGRISFGVQVASASRYAPYVIPGLIGIYFYTLEKFTLNLAQISILGMVIIFSFWAKYSKSTMQTYKESKVNWVNIYKETNSIDSANSLSHFPIYPGDYKNTKLKWKLNYLKKHKLNLYVEN